MPAAAESRLGVLQTGGAFLKKGLGAIACPAVDVALPLPSKNLFSGLRRLEGISPRHEDRRRQCAQVIREIVAGMALVANPPLSRFERSLVLP
jgi:hypothetical protein